MGGQIEQPGAPAVAGGEPAATGIEGQSGDRLIAQGKASARNRTGDRECRPQGALPRGATPHQPAPTAEPVDDGRPQRLGVTGDRDRAETDIGNDGPDRLGMAVPASFANVDLTSKGDITLLDVEARLVRQDRRVRRIDRDAAIAPVAHHHHVARGQRGIRADREGRQRRRGRDQEDLEVRPGAVAVADLHGGAGHASRW